MLTNWVFIGNWCENLLESPREPSNTDKFVRVFSGAIKEGQFLSMMEMAMTSIYFHITQGPKSIFKSSQFSVDLGYIIWLVFNCSNMGGAFSTKSIKWAGKNFES